MELTKEQVQLLARIYDIEIPDADLENIRRRLCSLLSAMERIEEELGADLDRTEPVPPVYPQENF